MTRTLAPLPVVLVRTPNFDDATHSASPPRFGSRSSAPRRAASFNGFPPRCIPLSSSRRRSLSPEVLIATATRRSLSAPRVVTVTSTGTAVTPSMSARAVRLPSRRKPSTRRTRGYSSAAAPRQRSRVSAPESGRTRTAARVGFGVSRQVLLCVLHPRQRRRHVVKALQHSGVLLPQQMNLFVGEHPSTRIRVDRRPRDELR